MKRHIIPIDVIDVAAFSNEFVEDLPSSWDCSVKERELDIILEYDSRFEDEVFEALHKAHCRFTLDEEDTSC